MQPRSKETSYYFIFCILWQREFCHFYFKSVCEIYCKFIFNFDNFGLLLSLLRANNITGDFVFGISVQVLFFGDSMRSDISPAKKYASWDTVLVLEEMDAELDDYCDLSDGNDDDSGPSLKRQHTLVSSYFVICVCVFMSAANFLISNLLYDDYCTFIQ